MCVCVVVLVPELGWACTVFFFLYFVFVAFWFVGEWVVVLVVCGWLLWVWVRNAALALIYVCASKSNKMRNELIS